MSVVYLVRHGQAGTRDHYDSLSDLGSQQARLLGEHLAALSLQFEAAYCGSLARQGATAEAVRAACPAIPEPKIDSGWDEFDLARVYSEMAPLLARDDPQFRRQYEKMQEALAASRGVHDAPIHRRWNDCDKLMVRSWVEGLYEYSGESWVAFSDRVRAAFDRICGAGHEGNVIVFTSSTPIAILAAGSLQIFDWRVLQLAGVQLNASFSTVRIRSNEVRLFQFNCAEHLADPAMRTFR